MTLKRLERYPYKLFINLNDNKLMNTALSAKVIKYPYRHCQHIHKHRHQQQFGLYKYSWYSISYPSSYWLLLFVLIQLALEWTAALPKLTPDKHMRLDLKRVVWPPMKHYDIWADDIDESRSATFQNNWVYSQDYNNDSENDSDSDSDSDNGNDNEKFSFERYHLIQNYSDHYNNLWKLNRTTSKPKSSKVLHIFPVPVDGECLSTDGRRTGSCFNAYECRAKGGTARGNCAMGFGVCCIFEANCNETISKNITYLVSPNFPSSMTDNFHVCNLKVKLLSEDISQLRIDFYHFTLGQPNRRTGVCDGDAFHVSGGPSGTFTLCGQNSGQHIYYDVASRTTPRQTLYGTLRPLTYQDLYGNANGTNGNQTMEIDISLNFSNRFLPTRLWEIRIAQIPFSQRAPAGCLQYFIGNQGIFQTFNFADNGRHLANQNYRICIRQETNMCSILYEPCDEESFRVGPSLPSMAALMSMQNSTALASIPSGLNSTMPSAAAIPSGMPTPVMAANGSAVMFDGAENQTQTVTMNDSNNNSPMQTSSNAPTVPVMSATVTTTMASSQPSASDPSSSMDGSAMPSSTAAPSAMVSSTTTSAAADDPSSGSDQMDPPTMPPASSAVTMASAVVSSSTASISSSTQSDDVEGSGGGAEENPSGPRPSRRPRPVRGGFDLLGFIRNAFNEIGLRKARIRRQQRQFFSTCRDRITMPCIIEDFLDGGLGPLPGCEPVHCGNQFCSSGIWPCRIESTVTPFYVGIHFGNGIGKGSAEDNIGACLKYQQVQCM